MKIPEGMTEHEVLEAIEHATAALAKTFAFGPHDVDDIKQQGALYAIEALESGKYDPGRPLANFLYTHVRNRLLNFRRDKYKRNDPPCRQCHNSQPGHTTHSGGQYCKKYEAWLRRNLAKQNIMCPLELTHINESRLPDPLGPQNEIENKEILALIDRKLPIELRSDYLRMREGVAPPKAVRDRIEKVVLDIVRESLS